VARGEKARKGGLMGFFEAFKELLEQEWWKILEIS
jgi:hypothetical protein